ncbi:MAG: TldE/PmbA family protein [Planctomycetota bacterium]|nr:MAG: TldE/PmbA family protein [Planctomycetota bacterium]
MQTYFHQLADAMSSLLTGEEVYTASFNSEDSDFVRFNKSEVRQAGSVVQHDLSVDLIEGQRHCAGSLRLTGDFETDRARVAKLFKELREKRAHLPEDPHLLYATEVHSTESVASRELPDGASAVADIQQAGAGRDLVGIYAAGGIHTGFANSLGQRNWHSTFTFNFDWSFYHRADKAVKTSYAGFRWDPEAFARKVAWASDQLRVIEHPAKRIEPGRYRVYLTPAALYDIVGLLAWGGFGLKAHKTKQTPLLKMVEEGRTLNPSVTVREHTAGGVAANFQEAGFLRPDAVTLIEAGAYKDCLVSPRSAKEFGVPSNGASAMESPESVEIAAGDLPQSEVLSRLGTGVYVSNLWYLNWSDRTACRTTGMTRFATFWVENGEIKAPLDVMRFDETAYRMLGDRLVGLTRERDFILDAGSYFQRSTASGNLPGALVEEFTFTL